MEKSISIISILAILCGILFSGLYAVIFVNHLNIGYETDVREVMFLGNYDKDEAKELLDNLYDALSPDDYTNLNLQSIWEDHDDDDVYDMVIEVCSGGFLPPNQMKMTLKGKSKTKIDKIYWDFNDTTNIMFYENGKQVDNYEYIFTCSRYRNEPEESIKEDFEADVRSTLLSPSSAIFTYKSLQYSEDTKLFRFYGWIESQNTYGAMIRKDFTLTLLPSKNTDSGLDYTWEYIEVDAE